MSRTSRSPRPVSPNAVSFAQEISPLDYEPTGYPKGSVQRIALIDPDVPAPAVSQRYFQDQQRTVRYGAKGRPLKRPRVVIDPGATTGTLAFLDYFVSGKPGDYQAYINFMATRSDQRGKGYARQLLDSFLQNAERSGVTHVNFGRVMHPAIWTLYTRYRSAYEKGAGRLSVSAKKDF